MFCFKLGIPQAVDSTEAVKRSVTVGTNHQTEMWSVQLYESVNDVVVQSANVAFRNFHHSWVPVLMDQSDFALNVIVNQTVGNSENIG